jgi:hydroxyacylglutathione hydrolase
MNKIIFSLTFLLLSLLLSAQMYNQNADRGEPVFSNEDVTFYKIDDHTWAGNGKMMANESLYIVEGNDLSLLIDAGTNIKDLDKIVASITSKPVTLVATHVHPDHTGASINVFDEIYIHPADTVNVPSMMRNYGGEIIFMKEGMVFDLGGRKIEVVHTPGHTPGSVTFLDYNAGYGFSGDAFGSGNLLMFGKFSMFIETCKKMKNLMETRGIKLLYPGHFMGMNMETPKRVNDMLEVSEGVMAGTLKGEKAQGGMIPDALIIRGEGFRINYNAESLR